MKMMLVRRANNDDIDRIVELRLINARYHSELVSDGRLRTGTESFFVKQTNKIIDEPQTKVLVGTVDEKIMAYAIGCIGQQHPIFDFGGQALIDDVYVSLEFQRHGYGTILIEHLLDWFKENNSKRIDLNVYEVNSKGAAFWNKQGFDTFFKRMTKEI